MTDEQKKAKKAEYDRARRTEKAAQVAAANRRWYEANKERILARQKAYNANPDVRARRNAWSRNFRKANPEMVRLQRKRQMERNPSAAAKQKAASQRWAAAHPDQVAELRRRSCERNREKIRMRHRAYYAANKEKHRDSQLRRKYGISAAEYDRLKLNQNGVCAICQKAETKVCKGTLRPLAVDHCHDSSRVRGLLCSNCNTGIGLFRDDLDLLKAAIEYLSQGGTL